MNMICIYLYVHSLNTPSASSPRLLTILLLLYMFTGCQFVIRLSLFTEYIGVCNFSWLLYHLSGYICCRLICDRSYRATTAGSDSDDNSLAQTHPDAAEQGQGGPLSPTERIRGPDYVHLSAVDQNKKLTWFDYAKYTWSTCATLFAVILIMYAISIKAYVLPVPIGGAYVIFFCVLTMLFYLEGLMIAIVATQVSLSSHYVSIA